MSRHFTAACTASGYAAMGNHRKRPRSKSSNSGRTVAESIAAERNKAARMANAMKSKK